ncbi:molybdopterin-dependent oxidoreductase [Actinopolymorpha pittospori]
MKLSISVTHRLAALGIAFAACVTLSGAAQAPAAANDAVVGAPVAAGRDVGERVTLLVDGAVNQPGRLSVADLARLPRQRITVTFRSGSGSQTHTYTGPRLVDVLDKVQPRFDPAIKNDKLRHVVTATGSEGYRAAVAWGEIDADFEAKNVLVALTEDGRPAADGRPRLVVPGDLHGGRYVSGLVQLHLDPAGD